MPLVFPDWYRLASVLVFVSVLVLVLVLVLVFVLVLVLVFPPLCLVFPR